MISCESTPETSEDSNDDNVSYVSSIIVKLTFIL